MQNPCYILGKPPYLFSLEILITIATISLNQTRTWNPFPQNRHNGLDMACSVSPKGLCVQILVASVAILRSGGTFKGEGFKGKLLDHGGHYF
jgi:hypothetical protein